MQGREAAVYLGAEEVYLKQVANDPGPQPVVTSTVDPMYLPSATL